MPLVVETGQGRADAKTFVSEPDFVQLCAERGITITEENAAIHLIKAMDWFVTFEPELKGTRSTTTQALPFPRTDLNILGRVVAPDTVPQEARYAQVFAAIASFNGIDLQPVEQNGAQLIRKKSGPIEKEWAYDANRSIAPVVPQAVSYMALLTNVSGFKYNQRA